MIIEGVNETKEFYHRNIKRDEAALSAIHLLYIAVSYRSALSDAIRAAASNFMLCTIEALMFSPLPSQNHINCLSLLFLYINEVFFFCFYFYSNKIVF